MSDIAVRFWGVRGGLPCTGQRVARYGGNTSCVEVRCGDSLLILDGGSGLRSLGKTLVEADAPVGADILFTHCHFDHICGLPFFAPCYLPDSHLRLWAGHLPQPNGLARALRRMMSEPLCPTGFDNFKATIELHDFRVGKVLTPRGGITVRTAPLNHPGGATGYRIEYGTRSVAYITDTEHHPGGLDPHVLALANEVDLMIYDCNYTDEEWPTYVGWGHSTWQQGVRLARAAGVKLLAVFHHDPERSDEGLDQVAAEANALLPGTLVAAEGMALRL